MNSTIKARIESIRRGEVPEGYKRTALGCYPLDWERLTLGSISERKGEYGLNAPACEYEEGLPKYLRITDIDEDGKYIDNGAYVKHIDSEKYVLRKGDLLFARTGASVGKNYLYDPSDDKLVFAGFLIKYHIKKGYNPYIVAAMCNIHQYNNWVHMMSARSGQPGINAEEYATYAFMLPKKLSEQEKIAEILAGQDRVIALKEELLAEKQKQKKYLMQQLLTGKKRLPGFSGEWINNNLEDICDVLDAFRRPYNRDQRAQMKGVYPYYGANGIIDYIDNYIFDEPIILLAEDGGDFEHYFQKPIAQKVIGKCWVNNHAHVLRAKQGYYIDFIFYLLEHKDIRKYINGTTRSKLTQDDMLGIQFYYPKNKKEQTAIAEILSTADKEIELLKKDIEQEKLKKKSLMQLLLTGIVRVSA